jgi:hypothetical protein
MLGPDQARTQESLGTLYTLMLTVNRYVLELAVAKFSPAQILGVPVDMLSNFPGLKVSLQRSLAHAQTWGPISQSLIGGFAGLYRFNQWFKSDADQILTILNSAKSNPGGQPDTAQKQQITSCLRELLDWLTKQRRSVEKQQANLRAFYDLVAADHAQLYAGENSIHNALDRLRDQGIQDVLNALNSGVGSAAIMTMIAAEVSTMMSTLRGYLVTLGSLADSNQTAQVSLSLVLTVWQTIEAKYASVIDDLNSADKSQIAILVLLDIGTAKLAWDQLTTYCLQLIEHTPKPHA